MRGVAARAAAVATVALVAAAIGWWRADIAAWVRLQHAVYLVTEGRGDEARVVLGALAARGDAAARATDAIVRRARRTLGELDIAAYPRALPTPDDARTRDAYHALSPPLRDLAAYLADAPPAADATALPAGGRSVLFSRQESYVRGVLAARRADEWGALHHLLAAGPPRDRSDLPSLGGALLPLRMRAAFETADGAALAPLVAQATLRGVPHPDVVGPALHALLAGGRADEALLFLRDLDAAHGAPPLDDLLASAAPFLAGPPTPSGPPPSSPAATPPPPILAALRAAVRDALDRDALRALLPPPDASSPDTAPHGAPGPRPLPIGDVTHDPADAAIIVSRPEPDALTIAFLSSGRATFAPAAAPGSASAPPPFRTYELLLRARATPAEGEWPILLLRAQDEAVARFYLCDDAPRWYRRVVTVDPSRPVAFSLAYLNNRQEHPESGEDRNAFVDRIVLRPVVAPR